jgi:hypothetical protein
MTHPIYCCTRISIRSLRRPGGVGPAVGQEAREVRDTTVLARP